MLNKTKHLRDITEQNNIEKALVESEQRLKSIINFLPDATFAIDLEGKVIAWNRAMEEMTQIKAEEILGKGDYEYSIPFYGERRPVLIDLFFTADKDIEKQYHSIQRTEDGSLIAESFCPHLKAFLWGKATALLDTNDKMVGAIESIRNITEYKNAEKELQEANEKLNAIINASPLAIICLDPEGLVTSWNPAAEKMFGWKEQEILGRFNPIVPENKKEEFYTLNKRILDDHKQNKRFEVIPRRKDGSPIEISLFVAQLHDSQSSVTGTLGIMEDITNRKKMEGEFFKSSKLESIGILAGGIAHDLNNILTVILGSISLAKIYIDKNEKAIQKLKTVENGIHQIKELTQQLQTFSKGGELVKKKINIEELIKESVNLVLCGSNVQCKFNFPNNLLTVQVDEGQLSQVINNLIINAIQAMTEGGLITIWGNNVINVEDTAFLTKGNYVKISIQDNGVGIPKENLQKIFDPYFSTKAKGNGLGLATTYSIVKKHGGYITVNSQVNTGTTFHIYLRAVSKITVNKEEIQKGIFPGKGKILIMDDKEQIKEVAGEMLLYLGYEVEIAKDGIETIELYQKAMDTGKPFDAVIVDLTIPGGMGGKMTIKKLHEIDPKVKAIVSSGYPDAPVMSNYRQYGFKGFAPKPYKIEELSKVLHKVIK